jgi:lipopolysaccharide kinase (Kdo/WaaP) family protein/glycosyl transferase family 2
MDAERWPRRRAGARRVCVAPGVDLHALVGPDVDPDRLLTSARCRLVKFQRKVVVGRIETAGGPIYVKRYNVHAPRVALASLGRDSPAFDALANAQALRARGFTVPEPVAAIEHRTAGVLRASFFLTREVPGAETVDVAWRRLLAFADPRARGVARRGFARALGVLFGRLHAAGVYHNDLKDVNLLVTGPLSAPRFTLLDLERVTLGDVPERRRVKNLVQLARTLGPLATRTDRARFLAAYVGVDRHARRALAARVLRAQRAKDRGRDAASVGARPTVTCTVVCQDEAAQIARCLESAAWCDEIVVVDGGSRDDTVEIARRHTDRILRNPWPGYRAQKQYALDAARGEWVFNLDADERVSDELANEIRRVLVGVPDDVDGFAMPRLVSYLGRWWWRGGWYPRRIVRLVRRTRTRWGGVDPHDRPEVPGRVRRLRGPIFHYTYDDVGDHLRTVSRLTDVGAREVRAGRRVGVGRLVLEPAWRFFRAYVVKRAVLEGVPGFFVAATDAFYTFLRWARVWDRERRAC